MLGSVQGRPHKPSVRRSHDASPRCEERGRVPTARSIRVTTWSIAAGVTIASMAMNFWIPLLPLYMQEIGAGDRGSALFWTAVANSTLGLARIVSGPVWGMISDRYGRKPMYVRTLIFASGTIVIVAAAQTPWHIAVAFAVQGLLSGFIPAAVALMSVSVPEERMTESLSLVTGGQYLGNTIGPALGAVLVVLLGYRGSILAGAALPIIAAIIVQLLVRRDEVEPRPATPAAGASRAAPARALWRTLPAQFYFAVFIFFLVFALTQLVRLLAPLALQDIEGRTDVAGVTGLAFSVSGAAAVAGILLVGRGGAGPGRLRLALVAGAASAAVTSAALAFVTDATGFIVLFSLAAMAQAAMIPITNTLIATNVSRERRGTGFGLASSAQALALMAGPIAAAALGAGSLDLAFLVIGLVFAGMVAFVLLAIREPSAAAPA